MTKKEYVFKFLDKVKGHWDKEPIIRDYLSKNDDMEYTEYLYKEFTGIVNEIITAKEEKKMWWLLWALERVKKQEAAIQAAEKLDLENLEELINHL